MWLPLLGLILGIALGILTDIQIPAVYENYLSIAVLLSGTLPTVVFPLISRIAEEWIRR